MAALSSTLSLSMGSYLHRYAFLKVSSQTQCQFHNFPVALTAILDELYQLGSYRNIAIHVWFGDSAPSSFHIGDRSPKLEPLISENWFIDEVSVTVQAATVAPPTEIDHLLIGFVSHQAAQLARSHALRLANSALRREIRSIADQIASHKLVNRARSLLSLKHRISPSQAHDLLVQASETNNKPILAIARDIVDALTCQNRVSWPRTPLFLSKRPPLARAFRIGSGKAVPISNRSSL